MLSLSIAFPRRLAPYALAFACVALQGIWFIVIAFSLFQSAVPFLHVSDESHGRVRPWFGILLTLFCLLEALVANFAVRSFGSEECRRRWAEFCGGGGRGNDSDTGETGK